MSWIEVCTRRPVAISMLTLALLLFGLVSLSRLQVSLLPDLSYPRLTIRAELPGAAPTEVETLLAKPIEEALGVIKNVRRVSSVSRAEQSDVTLEFNWGTTMDFAVLDVREKLDALELPKDAKRPIVLRFDPSQDPILRLGLAFKNAQNAAASEAQLKRLRRIAEDLVKRPLEGVSGVAAVKISGGLEDEVQVQLDLQKLAQLNLSVDAVAQRLKLENANVAGGRIEQGTASYLVRTLSRFQSVEEMASTILSEKDGRKIYLRDVASVQRGYKQRQAIIRIDGAEAVQIAVYREGEANIVDIAQGVRHRLEQLQKSLPADLQLKTLYDQSIFIKGATRDVLHAALEGGLLAVLVIYLFLRSAPVTAIVSASIPVSVIATFNVMYASGVTLNIMSLGGIALAVGLIVDDAIVVLEAIFRKHEQGLSMAEAAVTGTREVAGAVLASTLTTVAVFFPMVFVQGIAGQLFADQALVVTASLLFSLLVAMTLIPMLAARLNQHRALPDASPVREDGARWRRRLSQTRYALLETLPALLLRGLLFWPLGLLARFCGALMRPLASAWQRGYERLEARYRQLLVWALAHRALVLGSALLLMMFTALLLSRTGVELIPPFNQGQFSAELKLAPGAALERSDAVLRELATPLKGEAALSANYSVAGSGDRLDANAESGGENQGALTLVLKPEAYAQEAALRERLRAAIEPLPGVSYRFTRPTLFTLKTPLEVEVSGYDLDALAHVAEAIRARLLADDRYTEVETTLLPGHPEVQVLFDQERVAALGLQSGDLAQRVAQAVQGEVATRYQLADREIDVRVRGAPLQRGSIEAVANLIVNPESPHPVRLSSVAQVRLRSGPSEIRRLDQQRVIVVSANLAYGDLGAAIAQLQRIIAGIAMPSGVSAEVAGQSEEMQVSFRSLQLALALAVFLVYLVMASQFESLRQPLVILFSIPLAAVGAIGALFLTGTELNVIALIGMVMLIGIVVKNGIILIDLVNRLRAQGMSREQALLSAGPTRLRPILMTTLTALLGLLPMAIGGGQGAEMRQPLAITVIGGLSISTLLTLVVIPVVYTLIDRREAPRA